MLPNNIGGTGLVKIKTCHCEEERRGNREL
jgi:hypothetical protein